jgi:hypothetical protein
MDGRSDVLIPGEYDLGAFGPTILLKLPSRRSVEWLHGVLMRLSDDIGGGIDLAGVPEVHIKGVRALHLRHVDQPVAPPLRGPTTVVPDAKFDWALDRNGWRRAAGLLEPFLSGRPGHQYLTQEGRDAALVEVSFGEPSVRIADG